MKILFVASVYRHLVSFHIPYMQYFQKRGYKVYAIGIGEDKEKLESLGIQCIDVCFSRNPFSLDNYKAYKQLQQIFSKYSFELVHVHTPIAAFLTRLVYRQKKAGSIAYTAHGFHFFKGASIVNWLLYYPLEKVAARWTDQLIVMNDEDYENAKKLIASDKIAYVHGVGVEFSNQQINRNTVRESLGLTEDALIISYIAELNKNKNHLYLLKNWQAIKEKCPKAVLLIIGTGTLEQQLRKYIREHQLKDIRFLGYRSDVEQLLQISQISVLLSYREGLPKSTMESMYTGVPCIVSNTRGLRDLVIDGENGFVIPLDDDTRLITVFTQLLQSEELRSIMGEKARMLVEPYKLKHVLPEYAEIYEKLLK
ncbi:glycosyl transferase family 1 [[Bacillus] sp. KCTC 13219]|nr:glycosyl transferase family 1 [[Bacillus] sp. KCTC 13219]